MDLSIVIISYNTKEITAKCLDLLKKNFNRYPLKYEVIVVDNGSFDGSKKLISKFRKEWSQLKIINLKENLGYTKANNLGLKKAKGKYILFLNSDVFIEDLDFLDLIRLMEFDKKIGALTVKVNLEDGTLDKACHRGLPTLWRSFCYFIGLEDLFSKVPILNKIFGGYHLIHLLSDEIHEVEIISGAFFFTRTDLVKKIGGFDEDYFAYGEDIELSFQIKKNDYKIIYYPLWKVVHLKYSSGLRKKETKIKQQVNQHFFQAMKIFYKKHFQKKYPKILNNLVYFFIDTLERIKR